MRHLYTYILAILLSFPFALQAQQSATELELSKKSIQLIQNENSLVPNLMVFKPEAQQEYPAFILWFKNTFGFDENFGLKELSKEDDQIGYTHYRFQQTYKNMVLENTMYIFHVKAGKVVSMNGLLFDGFNCSTVAKISEKTALDNALIIIPSQLYMWQDAAEEQLLKQQTGEQTATYFPKAELVFASPDLHLKASDIKLAYKFDIYSKSPLKREFIYIDADNGKLIKTINRIHTADTPATAVTVFSGNKRITTDYYAANSFRLRETKRGNGIQTYNLKKGTSYGSAVDFTDSDTTWNNVNAALDQYATDAHWGAEMTYDFYKQKFNRNSINNSGYNLLSYVHYSSGFVNAFWDGTRMTYGDGNASYKPLVCLDVTGHEITHGLTTFTANLTYSYESGALNESFSDILGTAIEWFGDSATFEWDLGKKIGTPFRSFANPKTYSDPDTYKGTFWYTGAADNGGVHTNSGVQNYWFYTLAHGDTGTNDLGNKYKIDSIGINKAAAIAYRTLTYYLVSSSQYIDARNYSIIAAGDLFGVCSYEQIAVTKAWYAVGLGVTSGNVAVAQPNTTNITGGTVNNDIYRVIYTAGCGINGLDTLTSIKFNTKGTSNPAEITTAKLWYTGSSKTFSTSNLIATYNNPSGNFTMNTSQPLILGDNYFWLTYDVISNPKNGDTLDAQCLEVFVDSAITVSNGIVTGFRKIGPCSPPTSSQACIYMYTSNVVVDSINNSSNCSANSYSDFSSKNTSVKVGDSVSYNVTFTSYEQFLTIWLDANDDGKFSTSERLVSNKQSASFKVSGKFFIPPATQTGKHILRIKADYNQIINDSTGCAQITYGETEDYSLTVRPLPPNPTLTPSSTITFCLGDSQLFHTGYDTNYTYSWLIDSVVKISGKGHPRDSFYIKPAVAGTYILQVKATDNFGQNKTSAGVKVIVDPKSKAGTFTSSTSNICIGSSAKLYLKNYVGNINWQYLNGSTWVNIGQTKDTATIAPTTTTTYRAFITSGTCKSDSTSSITITVNPLPAKGTLTAGTNPICIGSASLLKLTGSVGTINWQYKNGASWQSFGSGKDTITVAPTSTTTYRTFVTTATCGADTATSIKLTVYPKSVKGTISATKDTICNGNSTRLILTGYTGAINWQLYNGSNWVNTGLTKDTVTVSPTTQTIYRAILTSGICSADTTASKTIIVNPIPKKGTLVASKNSYCLGDSTQLKLISYFGTITWQIQNGSIWQDIYTGTDSIQVNPTTTATYRAYVKAGNCGADTSNSIKITVNALPNAGSLKLTPSTICKGDSIHMSATGTSGQIFWQQNSGAGWQSLAMTGSNISFIPNASAMYRIYVTTPSCGNDTSTLVGVTVNPLPKAGSISAVQSTLCAGDSTNIYISGFHGNISWQVNDGSTWQPMSDTLPSIYIKPSVNSQYRAIASTPTCGIDTGATLHIYITPLPVGGQITASANRVCIGDGISLNLGNQVGNFIWQSYNGTDWDTLSNNGLSINIQPGLPYNSYRVTATTTNCGYSYSDTIHVTADPKTKAGSISFSDTIICYGRSFLAKSIGEIGSITWQYDNNGSWVNLLDTGNNVYIKPTQNSSYRAQYKSGLCPAEFSSSKAIKVNPSPISLAAASSSAFCQGDSAKLSASNLGSYYTWLVADTLWTSGATKEYIYIYKAGNYRLILRNSYGCEDTSKATSFNVYPTPAKPIITLLPNNKNILVSSSVNGNQWYQGATAITGATGQTFIPSNNGDYFVEYTDSNGCKSPMSAVFSYVYNGVYGLSENINLSIYPNPSNTGIYTIESPLLQGEGLYIRVTDILGRQVIQSRVNAIQNQIQINHAAGIYMMQVYDLTGKEIGVVRLVKGN